MRVNGTFYGAAGVVVAPDLHRRPRCYPGHRDTELAGVSADGDHRRGSPIPAGHVGAEFSATQQRGNFASGEPATAPEAFVAAAVTHSADGSNWWGTQGLYPLPVAPTCSNTNGVNRCRLDARSRHVARAICSALGDTHQGGGGNIPAAPRLIWKWWPWDAG